MINVLPIYRTVPASIKEVSAANSKRLITSSITAAETIVFLRYCLICPTQE
jgi:hypothetical protein